MEFQEDCPEKEKTTKGDISKEDASMMTNEMCYDSIEALAISSSNCDDAWVLDSGFTFQMTPYNEQFVDYMEVNNGIIHLENDHLCNVIGVGLVRIRLNDDSTFVMNNVRHVPT